MGQIYNRKNCLIYPIYGSNIPHQRDFGVEEKAVPLHQISEGSQNNTEVTH